MTLWNSMVLDLKIKFAEWNIQRWRKDNEITREYIERQKKIALKNREDREKQKELNRIKLEKIERKKAEIQKSNQDIEYLERQDEALNEILTHLEDVDIDQIPKEWNQKLRMAIEKQEVTAIKDQFLTILRSLSQYEDSYQQD